MGVTLDISKPEGLKTAWTPFMFEKICEITTASSARWSTFYTIFIDLLELGN